MSYFVFTIYFYVRDIFGSDILKDLRLDSFEQLMGMEISLIEPTLNKLNGWAASAGQYRH